MNDIERTKVNNIVRNERCNKRVIRRFVARVWLRSIVQQKIILHGLGFTCLFAQVHRVTQAFDCTPGCAS